MATNHVSDSHTVDNDGHKINNARPLTFMHSLQNHSVILYEVVDDNEASHVDKPVV